MKSTTKMEMPLVAVVVWLLLANAAEAALWDQLGERSHQHLGMDGEDFGTFFNFSIVFVL